MGLRMRLRRQPAEKAADDIDVYTPVTHRSPSPDSHLLPCCGRALTDIHPADQVTTMPSGVTCVPSADG